MNTTTLNRMPSLSRRARVFGPGMQLLSAVLYLLLTVQQASAQGGDGFIPSPFSSESFNKAVTILKPTWEQRLALEAAHEEYKSRFRQLRESDGEMILRRMHEVQSNSMFRVPKKRDVEELLRLRRTLMGQIMALEGELFERMAQSLDERQMGGLARIRRTRERAIWSEGEMMSGMGGGEAPDLVNIVMSLELTDEELGRIDAALVEYEISMNAAVKNLHDKTLGMISSVVDVMSQMGLDEVDFTNQDLMMEYGRRIQEAMQRFMKEVQEAAARVDAVGERGHLSLMQVMPAERKEAYEKAYLWRRYPDVYTDWTSPERMFEQARKIESLPGAARASIDAAEAAWRPAYDAVSKKLMTISDKTRATQRASFDFDGAGWEAIWQERQAVEQERNAINERAEQALLAAVGEEHAASLQAYRGVDVDSIGRGPGGMIDESVAGMVAEVAEAPGMGMSMMVRPDHLLPGPISDEEWAAYAARLDLSPDARVLTGEFLREYRRRFEQVMDEDYPRLVSEPRGKMWGENALNEQAASQVIAGRRAVAEQLAAIEEEFFGDVALVITESQRAMLPVIRRARECAVYDTRQMAHRGHQDGAADLTELLTALHLTDAEIRSIHTVLSTYEERLLPIVRSQHETLIAQEEAQIKGQPLMRKIQQDPEGNMDAWAEWERLMEPLEERLQELSRRRMDLEKATLPELTAALPPDAAARLKEQHDQRRYPLVFPDRGDARMPIESALGLTDLTAEQRASVEHIAADHDAGHRAICQEMVNLLESLGESPDWEPQNARAIVEWQRNQERVEMLRVDRDELNETTRRRLRAVLSEQQAARVRGLGVGPTDQTPQ